MATKNDFKILDQKCLKHFELASSVLSLSKDVVTKLDEKTQKRFGFYYLILQYVLGVNEYEELTDLICDQEFNAKLFNKKDNDAGVDAICINEDSKVISIFNFKFRESFIIDKKQSLNELLLSVKFLNAIAAGKNSFTGKLGDKLKRILECNDSSEVWTTKFYFVSNENKTLDLYSPEIKNLSETQGIEVRTIGLEQIAEFMSMHPTSVDAELLLPVESIISHSENSLSSDISYILCLCLTDLLRITSNNESLRKDTNIEDETVLSSINVEKSVLYENVRSYLLRSKYNGNILSSLDIEPEKFFFYNNGLTIVAEDIITKSVNSNKKLRLKIKNFQVLNGGQTLRTIHNFNRKNNDNIKKLSEASVLVRVMKVTDDDFKSRISEYTNSQNAISQIDLKSMRKEQIQLQNYLSSYNILYVRKAGEVGEDSKEYKYIITLQQLGQILYAIEGYPGQVSNKKKDIFTKHYDRLFHSERLLSEDTVEYVEAFFTIKDIYKGISDSYMLLKVFFILYLSVALKRYDYDQLITEFETFVKEQEKKQNMKISRILISQKFTEEFNTKFNIKQS